MALRRLAHTQNAAGSPRVSIGATSPSRSPSGTPSEPSTPARRQSYIQSPSATPSLSSSTPFDWDAVRGKKPAPYGSPLQNKRSRALRKSEGVGPGSPLRRAVVREKGITQKIRDIPSRIAFEIGMFPHNVPLPSPKHSAQLVGGAAHLLNLCVRVSQISQVPDSDLGWEEMYREDTGSSWFDWTVLMAFLLLAGSILNTLYVYTRIKVYRLHHRPDPVSSPNASFVSAQLDFEPLAPPPLSARLCALVCASTRFLLNMAPAPAREGPPTARVQQLQTWAPGEFESVLLTIYSPLHALLWMATTSANWMLMFMAMAGAWGLLRAQGNMYTQLIKDKDIIAAEVMYEYNEGFVYPRVNPVRRDVAVMTHQSEVVNVWED